MRTLTDLGNGASVAMQAGCREKSRAASLNLFVHVMHRCLQTGLQVSKDLVSVLRFHLT